MNREVLNQVLEDRAMKRPVIVATKLSDGAQSLIYADHLDDAGDLAESAAQVFKTDQSRTVETPDGEVFLHVHNPPLKMVMIGAVHIAQHLAPMAEMLGYAVTIVDPRGAFATEDRFPGASVLAEWPDEIWRELGVDRRTAVVALTHDPKIDDPALKLALESPAFYVGALGSKKTHGRRVDRLGGEGVSSDAIDRIHAPIGLDIGAKGPAEIAVSILAEVTSRLREREAA